MMATAIGKMLKVMKMTKPKMSGKRRMRMKNKIGTMKNRSKKRRRKWRRKHTTWWSQQWLTTNSYCCRMEKCKTVLIWRLGHRKYRYLYRQTYRAPFWLQKQLKAIGSEAVSNALITKQNLIELIKKEKLTRNSKTRVDKKHLKVGMQNNKLMKYFRTQNSLWFSLFKP